METFALASDILACILEGWLQAWYYRALKNALQGLVFEEVFTGFWKMITGEFVTDFWTWIWGVFWSWFLDSLVWKDYRLALEICLQVCFDLEEITGFGNLITGFFRKMVHRFSLFFFFWVLEISLEVKFSLLLKWEDRKKEMKRKIYVYISKFRFN